MTPKQRARVRLMQALYRWQIGGELVSDIEQEYLSKTKRQDNFSKQYFRSLYVAIINKVDELNQIIAPFLDRDEKELGVVERSILWLGCYELFYVREIPHQVVINEAIELAKQYGADGSYKYINSILDNIKNNLIKSNK